MALAVGVATQQDGVAEALSPDMLEQRVRAEMWQPRYVRLKHKLP